MGINYYQEKNICQCCKRYDRQHIGKSSVGWQFVFQAYNTDKKQIKSFKDWKKELQDGVIVNDFGQIVPLEDFLSMVESKKSESNNQYDWLVKHNRYLDNDWKDKEGYAFSLSEFS